MLNFSKSLIANTLFLLVAIIFVPFALAGTVNSVPDIPHVPFSEEFIERMNQLSTTTVPEFEQTEENRIGSGNFGCVYLGVKDGSPVAVKVFHDPPIIEHMKLEDLFERETLLNLDLPSHPNVLPLRLIRYQCKPYYIAFPYCSEGDLEVFLRNRAELSSKQFISILTQVTMKKMSATGSLNNYTFRSWTLLSNCIHMASLIAT